jgi:hypothetical protein
VEVPEPIRDEIAGWDLPPGLEEEMYRSLADSLEYGHEHICWQLPAPSPTYMYEMKLPDPAVPAVIHKFTFWLTYGPQEDSLYVMQADHEAIEPEPE